MALGPRRARLGLQGHCRVRAEEWSPGVAGKETTVPYRHNGANASNSLVTLAWLWSYMPQQSRYNRN
jgi:hypothetical protein